MILVFGETGQVGRELAVRADVVSLGRDLADFTDPYGLGTRIEDTRADAVIIAAAYTAVDKAESEEELATTVNATAPGAIARACAARDLPLVYISTDYVFDGSGSRPWHSDDTTGPLGAYGRSKLAGEKEVRAAGGRHAILRTSWVFSAHGNNFVKTMLRLSETRDTLTVVADQIGGPTAAGDIAATCLSLAERMVAGQVGGTYHFSGAPDVSWANFAREIFAQTGRKVHVRDIPSSDYPTPATRPANSRLECGKLETDYGIQRPDWRLSLSVVLKELKVI